MKARSCIAFSSTLILLAACASGGASTGGGAATGPTPAASTQVQPVTTTRWPVKTREHVDLWLHGFALLSDDTTLVPLFRRGYADQMTVLKLRLYVQALQDESTKYYHSYWLQAERQRENVLAVVDSIWQKNYRPKMQTYLNNSGQANGEILLSLPLGGEGRSQSNGKLSNVLTVTFPDTPAQADEAIYVIAHEAIASIANSAVADNTTPNDKRNGVSDRLASASAVRGGAMLLQRIAPELLAGYARYYLQLAKRPVGADPMTSLAAAFPLPDAIRDALSRQLSVVLGGI
jgi:hypothetical protein